MLVAQSIFVSRMTLVMWRCLKLLDVFWSHRRYFALGFRCFPYQFATSHVGGASPAGARVLSSPQIQWSMLICLEKEKMMLDGFASYVSPTCYLCIGLCTMRGPPRGITFTFSRRIWAETQSWRHPVDISRLWHCALPCHMPQIATGCLDASLCWTLWRDLDGLDHWLTLGLAAGSPITKWRTLLNRNQAETLLQNPRNMGMDSMSLLMFLMNHASTASEYKEFAFHRRR